MKEIFVNRQKGQPDWTLSSFESDDKTVKGVGCEDEKRNIKVKGETRIDAGRYLLTLTPSPKFSNEYFRDDQGNLILAKNRTTDELKHQYAWPHELITVTGVKNFDRILWHWGNTDDDTDGCYLVGSVFGPTKGQQGVLNSRKKYTEIYPIIWRALRAGQVYVNYIDHE
jgi:hypothetical protein